MKPIEGAIWQVSVPALVVGIVCATARDADNAVSAINVAANRDLIMAVFPELFGRRVPRFMRRQFAACS
jgi:hypothetical protein